jgi:hypothetical protein
MTASLETVLDAIQRNADVSARLLVAAESIRQAQESPMPGGVHQIVMQSPDSGERAAHKASMIAAILGALLVGLLIGGWGLIGRMADDARDLKRTQDRYNDYQAILWQRYPELRPENLKPKQENKP